MTAPIFNDSLDNMVADVRSHVLASCELDQFDPSLRSLLSNTAEKFFSRIGKGDFAQPLGLYFCAYRSLGKTSCLGTRLVGEFLCFYLLAADTFDDIEDQETAGKPFAAEGVPVATNVALMLLVLGLDALGRAISSGTLGQDGGRLLRIFNQVSLIGVSAQHNDLFGNRATCEELLAVHEGKASSLALLTECGACVAGASSDTLVSYRRIGCQLAQIAQIVDDVRDVFGKPESPDLQSSKATYPLACLRELLTASELEKYERARERCNTPSGMDEVRAIYSESGALERCAMKVEELRQDAHQLIVELPSERPYQRLLLGIVDALAGTLYETAELPASEEVRACQGQFAEQLGAATKRFVQHPEVWGDIECPPLRSWHLPFFLFSPRERCIYFPDLDGLPAEVLPFHADLLGVTPAEMAVLLPRIAPFLMAHEMAHARRFDLGLLSEDVWHEELIADALALAYVEREYPLVAQEVLEYSRRLLDYRPPSEELTKEVDLLLADIPGGSLGDGLNTDNGPISVAQTHALILNRLGPSGLASLSVRHFAGAPALRSAAA